MGPVKASQEGNVSRMDPDFTEGMNRSGGKVCKGGIAGTDGRFFPPSPLKCDTGGKWGYSRISGRNFLDW